MSRGTAWRLLHNARKTVITAIVHGLVLDILQPVDALRTLVLDYLATFFASTIIEWGILNSFIIRPGSSGPLLTGMGSSILVT